MADKGEELNVQADRDSSKDSSRLSGEFMAADPKFDSQRDSGSETDSELASLSLPAPPVTVLWRDLTVTTREAGRPWAQRRTILNNVTGFVEPRGVLGVVGPADSGKSALVAAVAGHLNYPARTYGEVLINGVNARKSRIQPIYISAADEPLSHLTIEHALMFTALLRWQDWPAIALEAQVRRVCQLLGLLGELDKFTHKVPHGVRRRVAVACQLMGAPPLLVLHDALEGVHEGDALCIMRAVHESARAGSTAIVQCWQPTTDICSFFSRAYVLCAGEVVYFGDAGTEAVQLLANAGMPCPPLYSPLEQFMHLIDPSFEVYLQVSQSDAAPDWNSRFSSMMHRVLQEAFAGSTVAKASNYRVEELVSISPDRSGWSPTPIPAWRQEFVLCRRLVAQGLRCFPHWLARIIIGALLAIIYAASYEDLGYNFTQAHARLTVIIFITGFLPILALSSLPTYHNSMLVYKRERDSCQIDLFTHTLALFIIAVPHVLVSAVITAVIFIPWSNLNDAGEAWGYFIFAVFLVMMCADAMVLACAAIFSKPYTQFTAALLLFLLHLLASGAFPGVSYGIQLPLNAVTWTAWGFRGLVLNEFEGRTDWVCPPGPAGQTIRLGQDPLPNDCVSGDVMATMIIRVYGIRGSYGGPKWYAAYILIGIYIFWTLLFLVATLVRVRLLRSWVVHAPMHAHTMRSAPREAPLEDIAVDEPDSPAPMMHYPGYLIRGESQVPARPIHEPSGKADRRQFMGADGEVVPQSVGPPDVHGNEGVAAGRRERQRQKRESATLASGRGGLSGGSSPARSPGVTTPRSGSQSPDGSSFAKSAHSGEANGEPGEGGNPLY